MLTEKEKLEEELDLLKESLELEVISEDEFLKAKNRIQAKINELDSSVQLKGDNLDEEKPKLEQIEQKIEIKELSEEDIDVQKNRDNIKLKEKIYQDSLAQNNPEQKDVKIDDDSYQESKKEPESEEYKDTISLDFSWLKKIFGDRDSKEKQEESKTINEARESEFSSENEISKYKAGNVFIPNSFAIMELSLCKE